MRTSSSSGRPWPWLLAPPLAVLAIAVGFALAPDQDCSGYTDEDGAHQWALAGLTVLAALACVGAALRMLLQGSSGLSLRATLTAFVLVALLFGLIVVLGSLNEAILSLVLLGAVVTLVALACLLFAWAGGRGREQAGVLVPLYFLGMGLFVLPSTYVVAALIELPGC